MVGSGGGTYNVIGGGVMAPGGTTVDAVEFTTPTDAALAWGNPGISGITDSDKGTIVIWYKLNQLASTAGNDLCFFDINSGSFNYALHVRVRSSDDKIDLRNHFASNTAETLDGNWHCMMLSWDSDVAGGGASAFVHMYRDGTDVEDGSPTYYSSVPDISRPTNVGSHGWGATNYADYDGQMALLWYDDQQVLDFSSSTVRDKFYNAGKFVDVGSDGSTPTGTAPRLCLKGNATAFKTNVGLGSNPADNIGAGMTTVTGPAT